MTTSKVLLRLPKNLKDRLQTVADKYYLSFTDVIKIASIKFLDSMDDEYDIDDQVFIKPAHDGFYTVLALTPMAEFNEYFKSDLSDEGFDTISGLLLQAFGHLPKRGEKIELGGFHFEVIRANARRIQLLRTSQSS